MFTRVSPIIPYSPTKITRIAIHRSINIILEADYDLYGNPSRYGQHPVYFESESGTELAAYARAQAEKENSQCQADGQAHKKKRCTK
jgi:hypothetical protein